MRLEPNDSQQGFRWIIGTVVLILAIVVGYSLLTATPQPEQKEEVFSPYDGSCFVLDQAIKRTMNDPDSYEHVETKHVTEGDKYRVTTRFRGKNAYGAKVLTEAEGILSRSDGKLISWRMIE